MLKKIAFLVLLAPSLYAQTNFVKVNYGLKIGYDEGFSNSTVLKDYYSMAQKGADQLNFDLEANKMASYFRMKEIIENDEAGFAISFSEGSNSYYTELKSVQRIKYLNDMFGEFRINDIEKTEWRLENETKYIDSYLCFKETAEQIVVNKKGTFKHPVVA